MSKVSVKQAYLMGWMYNNNVEYSYHNRCSFANLNRPCTEPDLQMYQYCSTSLLDSQNKIDFVRGFVDRRAIIINPIVTLTLEHTPLDILRDVSNSFEILDDRVVFEGINALELLCKIYTSESRFEYSNAVINYNLFLRWAQPHTFFPTVLATFNWSRKDKSIPGPTKNKFTDSGYDLHLVSKIKEEFGVHYFDTGITVEPSNGYYMEIVGRSSISKSGWMLANNVGIIDASYRGTIIVALIKVNPLAEDLKLPAKLVQMIPRQLLIQQPIEIEEINVDTSRGDGGFGSSDTKS